MVTFTAAVGVRMMYVAAGGDAHDYDMECGWSLP